MNPSSLSPAAVTRMKASRAVVDRVVAANETAYGINTGFGKLASVRISAEQVRQLQVNLVRSHACGNRHTSLDARNARHDAAPRQRPSPKASAASVLLSWKLFARC